MTNLLLTDLIRDGQSSRSTPCALITSPDAVVEEFFLTDLENVSNRAAHFLDQELLEDQTTFFYMGPSDLRYFIFVLAAMKTGRCVMFPSPGNTVPSNERLFEAVGAKTLLFAPEAAQALSSLLETTLRHGIRAIVTPSYAEMMSREPTDAVYHLTKSFEEVKDVPVLGLHTSGTSGHPKPIYWTHGGIATLASHAASSGVYPASFTASGAKSLLRHVFAPGEVVMMPFPLYHMGGISPLFFTVFYGQTHVMPTTGTRMTPENISAMLRHSRSTTAWLAPSLLEDMLEYPPGLDTLAAMRCVVFGGGPMNPTKGDKLSKLVPLLGSYIGSTEGGPAHLVVPPDNSHWSDFNFIDVGQRMEEVESGVFELVYPNTELTRRCQLYFHAYPELSEYRTRDLFSPTPGKKGWWAYRGRTDNWVTMSNGLKMDPTDIENTIGTHQDVRGVLVAGDRRHRLCLIIELRDKAISSNDEEREEMLTRLWPTIEQANKMSSKFGRIPRELVLFAAREKPFLKASKGTIQRRLTIDAYAEEIEDLYAKAEGGLLTHGLPPLEALDQQSLTKLLQYLYSDVLELEDDIGIDEDIFARGVDSFGIMTVSSRLKAALRQHGVNEAKLKYVSVQTLYSASTIGSVAQTLSGILHEHDTVGNPGAGRLATTPSGKEVLELVEKYQREVQKLVESAPIATNGCAKNGEQEPTGRTILLTGSTGSLGCYLLVALLAQPDVKKVICLNRGVDAKARQVKALESRRLPPLPLQSAQNGHQASSDRVVFLQGELDKERLGLSHDDYALVARETTTILHNAWPVNFLMPLRQFEPQLRGLLRLMALSLARPRGASLLFVSSISAGMSARGARQRVPEVVLDATATNADDLLPQGYARSKYVSEKMLETFARSNLARRGVASAAQPVAAVLRVGQICGPRVGSGPWNKWEWFPSLVLSSRFLGVAPDDIGHLQTINWIPVDELASIMTDLVEYVQPAAANGYGAGEFKDPGTTSTALQVFNVVNPSSSSWNEVLPALQAKVRQVVPPSEWVARLEESVEKSTYILDQNPAAKLLAFYKGALVRRPKAEPIYDVHNLTRGSSHAANLGPIQQYDLKRWMETWKL